jgi:hypothetical protein
LPPPPATASQTPTSFGVSAISIQDVAGSQILQKAHGEAEEILRGNTLEEFFRMDGWRDEGNSSMGHGE